MANVKVKFLGPSDNLIIPGDRTVYHKGDEVSADRDVIFNLVKNHQHKFEALDSDVELPAVSMPSSTTTMDAALDVRAEAAAERHTAATSEGSASRGRGRSRSTASSQTGSAPGGDSSTGESGSSN